MYIIIKNSFIDILLSAYCKPFFQSLRVFGPGLFGGPRPCPTEGHPTLPATLTFPTCFCFRKTAFLSTSLRKQKELC